jgi:MOSC domain-containing protein YiiM
VEESVSILTGRVASVHAGTNADLSKTRSPRIEVALDGIVGDNHQSHARSTWAGDKQPQGTIRRNERQWSAISIEELAAISAAMDLGTPLSAANVGVNLCFEGIPELSRLPKGTTLKFPSGAELMVEEYNPPCHDMGKQIAMLFSTTSGEPVPSTAFSKAAKLTRGIVGVVEVAGVIREGDAVTVNVYEPPAWLLRSESS